ncbi:hypothetical protein EG831_06590, partial [bacterium]|nr:hypothetical protein [bacterium]
MPNWRSNRASPRGPRPSGSAGTARPAARRSPGTKRAAAAAGVRSNPRGAIDAARQPTTGDTMFDRLERILSAATVDYADIRHEVMEETAISFSGRELTTVSANTTDGFVVRVLHRGGWASVAFTKEEQAGAAVRTAV